MGHVIQMLKSDLSSLAGDFALTKSGQFQWGLCVFLPFRGHFIFAPLRECTRKTHHHKITPFLNIIGLSQRYNVDPA